ncbi:hypothetical protein MNBD_PLANCTO02-3269 [hydrothermal vent metagenome]|uniref:Uncharacterized protein n=1 Tax=hydrothermal vent metagenome TaxID=652676 RepID=A0A3B1D5P1_9ZZZZ
MTPNKITTIAMTTLFGIALCTAIQTNAHEDSDVGIVRINDNAQQTSHSSTHHPQGDVVYEGGAIQHPSPFKEWEAPTTHRIYPGFFYYQRAYPDYWQGQPHPAIRRTAPVIFTPTDTTQLGYYYQHVPVWQPNPRMIPPEPHPATWHNWNKLPANVVWNRRGVGEPNGVVPPPGHDIVQKKNVKSKAANKPEGKTNVLPPAPVPIPAPAPEAK